MEEYILKTLELLKIEHEAEVLEIRHQLLSESPTKCEILGLSILNLDIHSVTTSLFGRTAVELKCFNNKPLPSTFRVGDEIELQTSTTTADDKISIHGIVTKVDIDLIEVTVDNMEEVDVMIPPVRLNRRASEVSYKKLCTSLQRLTSLRDQSLVQYIFDSSKSIIPEPDRITLRSIKSGMISTLNQSQINAIESSLSPSSIVSLIHGPPGTGKTATLAELIVQAVSLGQRILVCAPSNAAVDNLLDRLLNHEGSKRIQCVRLGHPARVDKRLLDYCLDSQLAQSDGKEIIDDIKDELNRLRLKRTIKGGGNGNNSNSGNSYPERRMDGKSDHFISTKLTSTSATTSTSTSLVNNDSLDRLMTKKERYLQLKQLQKDLRKYEKKVVSDLLKSCHVIFATCVGASTSLLKDMIFDLVIIDEAAQGLEAEAWIPIQLGKRLVLAGDPNQLPPTIKSEEAANRGLGISLLERLMKNNRYVHVTFLLYTQYRMHHTICDWASSAMYQTRLKSHDSAAERSLNDWMPNLASSTSSSSATANVITHNSSILELYAVMTLIDTSGCDQDEMSTVTGSKYNEIEAEVVRRYVSLLIYAGANPNHIGIITPYGGQVAYLKSLFTSNISIYPKGLENVAIRTVDGFQGGEKEIIVLSLVRSNELGEVGFLSDKRRINVAVTRARRHLAIIGDVTTCENNEFMSNLLNYVSNHGDHRSAMEFLQEDWTRTSLAYEPYITDQTEIETKETKDISNERSNDVNTMSSNKNSKKILKKSSNKVPFTSSKHKFNVSMNSNGNINSNSINSNKKDDDDFEAQLQLVLIAFSTYSPLPVRAMSSVNASMSLSGKDSLVFSSTISSFHRRLIHEVCENFPMLSHISLGEMDHRQLHVTRPPESILSSSSSSSVLPLTNPNLKDIDEKTQDSLKENTLVTSKDSINIKSIHKSNEKKSSSSSKLVNRIGSTVFEVSDDLFNSSLQEAISSFKNYTPISLESQNNISAIFSSNDSLLFSSKLPPHRRQLIKRQCEQSQGFLTFSVINNPPQVQISRPVERLEGKVSNSQVSEENEISKVKDKDTLSTYQLLVEDDDNDDDDNVKEVSPISIESKIAHEKNIEYKKEKSSSSNNNKSSMMVSNALKTSDLDDDEILALAMMERQAYEKEHQYRLKSKPFPNNEKINQRRTLHAKLNEAAEERKPKSLKEAKLKK